MRKIVALTNDKQLAEIIEQTLKPQCLVTIHNDTEKFFEHLSTKTADLAILDNGNDNSRGLENFRNAKKINPHLKTIMLSAIQDIPNAVRATKLGVDDYMNKPVDPEKLRESAEKIFSSLIDISPLIIDDEYKDFWFGTSKVLSDFIIFLKEAIKTEKNIVLFSKQGCMPEQIAKILNYNKHFGKKNVSMFDLSVFEKESSEPLFWSFLKQMFHENPQDGTIFVFGLNKLPEYFKNSVLDFILNRDSVNKSFSSPKIILNICQFDDLSKEQIEKTKGIMFELHMPLLKDRREDILFIVNSLMKKYSRKYGKDINSIASDVNKYILIYDWPGNYEELDKFVEASVVRCKTNCIMSYDAPINIQMILSYSLKKALLNNEQNLVIAQKIFKKELIDYLFETSNKNLEAVSKFLDCPRDLIE